MASGGYYRPAWRGGDISAQADRKPGSPIPRHRWPGLWAGRGGGPRTRDPARDGTVARPASPCSGVGCSRGAGRRLGVAPGRPLMAPAGGDRPEVGRPPGGPPLGGGMAREDVQTEGQDGCVTHRHDRGGPTKPGAPSPGPFCAWLRQPRPRVTFAGPAGSRVAIDARAPRPAGARAGPKSGS